MSYVRVQCKGSGQKAGVSLNAKKATCHWCGGWIEVAGNGNFRKNMRTTTTARLRKGR